MSVPTFLIVGAGHAGATAAVALRDAGFGGRIVLIGDDPNPPYERPPLSKDLLTAPDKPPSPIFPSAVYDQKNIELLLGDKAVAIDPAAKQLRLASGENLGYDKLLLACGASARRYPLLDALGEAANRVRTLDDAQKIQAKLAQSKSLIIVGGGVIGLEVAASANSLGLEVTVLERAPKIMARGAPAPLVAVLTQRHRDKGVRIETSVDLAEASLLPEGGLRLEAADGRVFDGDHVVYGVGVELNLDLARAAGLVIDDGVVIDSYGRTNDPDIFAAGDIARQDHPFFGGAVRQETWANATGQGASVARAMVIGQACDFEPPWFWTDQYGSNFQIAGRVEADEWVPRGDVANGKYILFGLTDGVVTGAVSIDLGKEMKAARMMIAAAAKPDRAALADRNVDLRKLARSQTLAQPA